MAESSQHKVSKVPNTPLATFSQISCHIIRGRGPDLIGWSKESVQIKALYINVKGFALYRKFVELRGP